MSQRYLGGVITANPTAPTLSAATGVWTLEQQFQNVPNWPKSTGLVSRSVRLRSSASAYFNRTPASASNRKTWTWSGWVKRGTLGVNQQLVSAANTASNYYFYIRFLANDTLEIFDYNAVGGVYLWQLATSQVFRDPSAWYHLVFSVDTTQATASNRVKLYVNGVQVTAFGTANYPSLNFDTQINYNGAHYIGTYIASSSYLDGYLTEINFIDGQALTPSSFGFTDGNGIWQPTSYAGTYGTNGFYLNFSDNSGATATTIGKDYSGNGNNWTPNNISVTAGVTYDSMIDVPTLYADGGNGRGNYATFNPLLYAAASGYRTLSNGNLTSVGNSATNNGNDYSTISTTTTGKWYAEFTVTGSSGIYPEVGIIDINYANNGAGQVGTTTNSACYLASGSKVVANVTTSYGSSFTTNDVIGVAVDCTNGTLTFYKNNVSQGTAYSWTGGTIDFYFSTAVYQSGTGFNANFGQRPFSYTPPTGFVALNTQNLPTPTISNGANYMAATLYTGNGSTQTVNNSVGFYPDFNWIKSRSNTGSNVLVNSVVGGTKQLFSNLTDAEQTNTNITNGISSSGIALGNNSSGTGSTNQNTYTYVLWQWLANAGSTVSNTAGSITSTVSAGATQGFSVATFTTPSSFTNATVGHGLGVAPKMIIVKRRTTGDWITWHTSLGTNGYVTLNTTSASSSNSGSFNGTSSTTWTLGSNTWWQASASDWVAYCFAEVAGYSKFGSYTGNGSTDGPFVYLGFRPRWLMIKRTDTTNDWIVYDSSRSTFNAAAAYLFPDLANAEGTGSGSSDLIDFTSNGFKLRCTTLAENASGGTYIYACFAENPFNISRAR
jgi:hypothetical protein